MSIPNSKIFSKINLTHIKSKAIENRVAADGQTAVTGAWGGASTSRKPSLPLHGNEGFSHPWPRMHCLPLVSGILDTSRKPANKCQALICKKRGLFIAIKNEHDNKACKTNNFADWGCAALRCCESRCHPVMPSMA